MLSSSDIRGSVGSDWSVLWFLLLMLLPISICVFLCSRPRVRMIVSTPSQPMYYVGQQQQQQQQQPQQPQQPPYASATPIPAAHAYTAHYPSAPIPHVSGIVTTTTTYIK
jgi:hypothetical protein